MNLVSIRIITSQIEQLINFYELLAGKKAIRYTPDFAELKTGTATLAIGSTKTLQFFGGDSVAASAKNRSAIIEFQVSDLKLYFDKLPEQLKKTIIQEPTLMPWGNESLLLRDPDGNLVNLFTTVTAQAIEKFNS